MKLFNWSTSTVTMNRRAVYSLMFMILIYFVVSFVYFEALLRAIPKTARSQLQSQKWEEKVRYLSEIWEMDTIDFDEEMVFTRIEDKTSLPLLFSLRRKKDNLEEANSSAECPMNFPDIYKLQHNNVFWQEVLINKTSFFLLSAFLDDRVKGHPYIRILVVTDGLDVQGTPFCQVWHKNENYVNISAAKMTTMYDTINYLRGYRYVSRIVSCPLTPGVEPGAVSLVEQQCDKPQNVLRVINNKVPEEEVKELGICYRAVHFPYEDKSPQIVEWFEFIKLMGVNKVHLHILQLNPNVKKVFDYYTKQGMLETREISLPGYQPNLMGLRHIYLQDTLAFEHQVWIWEHIPLNDCFYRNMFRYKQIIIQDMDEALVPLPGHTYREVISDNFDNSSTHMSFNILQYYNVVNKSSDIPSFMYMLSRVYRKPNPYQVNSIHNPRLVAVAHSHYPLYCINGQNEIVHYCPGQRVNRSLAFWHHYTMRPDNTMNCNITECAVIDISLLEYKDQLVAETVRALDEIFN